MPAHRNGALDFFLNQLLSGERRYLVRGALQQHCRRGKMPDNNQGNAVVLGFCQSPAQNSQRIRGTLVGAVSIFRVFIRKFAAEVSVITTGLLFDAIINPDRNLSTVIGIYSINAACLERVAVAVGDGKQLRFTEIAKAVQQGKSTCIVAVSADVGIKYDGYWFLSFHEQDLQR